MKTLKIIIVLIIGYNICSAQQNHTLSNVDKIFGLSKFWHEANQNFVFMDAIGQENLNNSFKQYITEAENTTSDYEYYRLLQKFCAELKDGHTNVYFPEHIRQMRTHFGDIRLIVRNIEGRAIITHVNQSNKAVIPIGSEIVSVNGLTTHQYIEANVKPYIAASTDYVRQDMSIRNLLVGLEGDTYSVQIKAPNGQTDVLQLVHSRSEKEPLFPEIETYNPLKIELKDSIAVITINTFENAEVLKLLKSNLYLLENTKGIIIDLRNNPGGSSNVAADVLSYFTKDTVITGAKSYSRKHIPTYYAWGKFMQPKDTLIGSWAKESYKSFHEGLMHQLPYDSIPNIASTHFIKPTVVLTSHHTASAAEDFLIMARDQQHFTVLGEKTNGSTGQPLFFDLPGGAKARVCTKKDTYPDGKAFVGTGIQPDMVIKPTYEDFMNGFDRQMTEAFKVLAKNKN